VSSGAYAKGSKAWGICRRCGLRDLLNNLVFDEYYPDLRVHPECKDYKHPQEHLVDVRDPIALWKPSPEDDVNTPPVLSGVQNQGGIGLSWTPAEFFTGRVENYKVYKSIGGADFTLLSTFVVTYTYDGEIESETLSTEDPSVSPGVLVDYYVVAYDFYNNALPSNIVRINATSVSLSWNLTNEERSSPIITIAEPIIKTFLGELIILKEGAYGNSFIDAGSAFDGPCLALACYTASAGAFGGSPGESKYSTTQFTAGLILTTPSTSPLCVALSTKATPYAVVGSVAGKIYSTTNISNFSSAWNTFTVGANDYNAVSYPSGAYNPVLVGNGGSIAVSTSVSTQTAVSSPTGNDLWGCCYDSYTNQYLACGAAGTILKTSDSTGATGWSLISIPGISDVTFFSISDSSNSGFGVVACGYDGSGHGVVAASIAPYTAWTVTRFPSKGGFNAVTYSNRYRTTATPTGFYIVGNTGASIAALKSETGRVDTSTWINVTTGTTSDLYCVSSGVVNDLIAGGNLGTILLNPS